LRQEKKTSSKKILHKIYFFFKKKIIIIKNIGSGKTITAELAILRLLKMRRGAKTIYIAPLKALARERLKDWQAKLQATLHISVLELTGFYFLLFFYFYFLFIFFLHCVYYKYFEELCALF
jgi:replicative superfamily II helicase